MRGDLSASNGNLYCCKGVRDSITMSTLNGDLSVNDVVLGDQVPVDKGLSGSSVYHDVVAVDAIDDSCAVDALLLLVSGSRHCSAAEQSLLRTVI